MGLIDAPNSGRISPFQEFKGDLEQKFRDAWTDNADICSFLYTGTPALKTDFTRTGKRTLMGAVWDGIHAVMRYYINNFTDGYYHDCLDMATLRLTPKNQLRSRTFVGSIKFSIMLIVLSTILMSCFVYKEVLPQVTEQHSFKQTMFHHSVVAGTFLAGVLWITSNGRKFIDDSTRYV